jgi:hypothetical protein
VSLVSTLVEVTIATGDPIVMDELR